MNRIMELEDMKSQWSVIEARIKKLESENEAFRREKRLQIVTTEKKQLIIQYRIMVIMCFSLPNIINLSMRDVLNNFSMIAIAVSMIVMGVLIAKICHGLTKVDYGQMSVKDAINSILKYERMQRNKQIIGLSLGIPTIIILLWNYYTYDPYIFYGGLFGVAIGAIVGLKVYFRIMSRYKTMRQAYEEDLS